MSEPHRDRYGVIRLNSRSEAAWAVIDSRTGAIMTEGGDLVMRLAYAEALRIAEVASRAARLAAPESEPAAGDLIADQTGSEDPPTK